jgi:hypothetical protein
MSQRFPSATNVNVGPSGNQRPPISSFQQMRPNAGQHYQFPVNIELILALKLALNYLFIVAKKLYTTTFSFKSTKTTKS